MEEHYSQTANQNITYRRRSEVWISRMKRQPIFLAFLLTVSCSLPTGLEPVSGIEGVLKVDTSVFAGGDVKAVALVVVDRLDIENLADHFIAYSEPITPCADAANCDSLFDFFIQLKPGGYLAAPVGLLIPPEEFIVSIDSILSAPELPLKLPGENINEILMSAKSFLVKEEQINLLDEPWEVTL